MQAGAIPTGGSAGLSGAAAMQEAMRRRREEQLRRQQQGLGAIPGVPDTGAQVQPSLPSRPMAAVSAIPTDGPVGQIASPPGGGAASAAPSILPETPEPIVVSSDFDGMMAGYDQVRDIMRRKSGEGSPDSSGASTVPEESASKSGGMPSSSAQGGAIPMWSDERDTRGIPTTLNPEWLQNDIEQSGIMDFHELTGKPRGFGDKLRNAITGRDWNEKQGITEQENSMFDNLEENPELMALLEFGLGTMQAGGQPGATFGTAVGYGGLNALQNKEARDIRRQDMEMAGNAAALDQYNKDRDFNLRSRTADQQGEQNEVGNFLQFLRIKEEAAARNDDNAYREADIALKNATMAISQANYQLAVEQFGLDGVDRLSDNYVNAMNDLMSGGQPSFGFDPQTGGMVMSNGGGPQMSYEEAAREAAFLVPMSPQGQQFGTSELQRLTGEADQAAQLAIETASQGVQAPMASPDMNAIGQRARETYWRQNQPELQRVLSTFFPHMMQSQ